MAGSFEVAEGQGAGRKTIHAFGLNLEIDPVHFVFYYCILSKRHVTPLKTCKQYIQRQSNVVRQTETIWYANNVLYVSVPCLMSPCSPSEDISRKTVQIPAAEAEVRGFSGALEPAPD